MLTITDHSRDSAGMTYVYPVISRRSGGLSIGINLNPNNACNWRCIYCQVPDLIRGSAPIIDLSVLRQELVELLEQIHHGDFYHRFGVPLAHRTVRDIAISGNGEPTSSKQLLGVIQTIESVLKSFEAFKAVRLVLISNGSLVAQVSVQEALRHWNGMNGEVWFKVDSATAAGIELINGVHLAPEKILINLQLTTTLCKTWIQTCVIGIDGPTPSTTERAAYLAFMTSVRAAEIPLEGVLLYRVARPSMQPEASRLVLVSESYLQKLAEDLQALGFTVQLNL